MKAPARPQRSEDGRGRQNASLTLIHTTKSPNPRPATVSAVFGGSLKPTGELFLGDVLEAEKLGPGALVDLIQRRSQ